MILIVTIQAPGLSLGSCEIIMRRSEERRMVMTMAWDDL